MDFDLDETQRELRDLAADLLAREATTERLEAYERSDGVPYEAGIWKALAQAGVLGACLPEEQGGAGLGMVALTAILREVGAHVAPVPAYASLALGSVPIARHGTAEQRALLARVATGESVLTGAFRAPGLVGEPAATARPDGAGHVLDGAYTFVPYAAEAAYVLVPARIEGTPIEGARIEGARIEGTHSEGADIGVFLVEPDDATLTVQPSATSEPLYRIELAGVRAGPAALLGGVADGAAWRTLWRSARAGAVALSSGVVEGALKLTTEHVKTREQFGRPLAQFQAVTVQVGDVYIAKRALEVAVWAGAWRLDHGLADADEVLAVAAYTAADPVVKALYACQHLHGGIGLDVTYPLHRYFAWAKHYGHLLGGPDAQLDDLGSLLGQGA